MMGERMLVDGGRKGRERERERETERVVGWRKKESDGATRNPQ